MRKILLILILILIVFSNLIFSQEKPFQLKKFDYEINIDARVLPLFVVDKKGNPVFDLKKSDLTLYVNGKKTEIADLIRYKFGYTTKEKKEVSKTVYKKKVKPLDRLVFIVFDTIFNSRYGIKRMKIIAQKIIESGNKGDSFIIMGLNEDDGLFQIYGPSENKNELIKKIKKKLLSSGERIKINRRGIENAHPNLIEFDQIRLNNEKKRRAIAFSYKFLFSLDKLKKILDLVKKQKVVYIFSTGIFSHTINTYTNIKDKGGEILGKLTDSINILNKSGASMFMINPGRIQSEFNKSSGKLSLKIISRETGGEFFEGSIVKTIVENVKKRTDAYYELFFNINKTKKRKNVDKVSIVSKNRKIKIYTPKSSIAAKKYGEMSLFERKLHIIGLIEGEKWSNVNGNVINKKYKRKVKSRQVSLSIKTPKELLNMYSDIYKVKLKKNKREPDIIKISKNTNEIEQIIFDNVEDELLFFVIISKHSSTVLVGRVE